MKKKVKRRNKSFDAYFEKKREKLDHQRRKVVSFKCDKNYNK
jgi:hypothetical protein